MKKTLLAFLTIQSVFFLPAWGDDVKVTTYYPSPYGDYNELTTSGNTTLATDPIATVGIGATGSYGKLDVINYMGDGIYAVGDTLGMGAISIGSFGKGIYGIGEDIGIEGISTGTGTGTGVSGIGDSEGVSGYSQNNRGVYGLSDNYGVYGYSLGNVGVYGETVGGISTGIGVEGVGATGLYGSGLDVGVSGEGYFGVIGKGTFGLYGTSDTHAGLCAAGKYYGILAYSDTDPSGIAIYAYGNRYDIYAANSSAMSVFAGRVGIGMDPSTSYQLQLSQDTAAKPGGGSWTNSSSDRRVKQDIEPFSDGLEAIKQINPVWYRYNGKAGMPKPENGRYVGVVAQEIKEIAPYTVGTYKTKLNSKDSQETELYNFDGSALTYILINAVKEQQKEIDELKSEVQTLKKAVSLK